MRWRLGMLYALPNSSSSRDCTATDREGPLENADGFLRQQTVAQICSLVFLMVIGLVGGEEKIILGMI